VCRAAAGTCDVADVCDGQGATCPDQKKPAGTQCRAASGDCDVAETCTGSSATCPANAFKPATTTCRGSAGLCDLEEKCTGTSATCPANQFKQAGLACRQSTAACDAIDGCTGSSADCPDVFQPAGTACRPVDGACDVGEACTGTSKQCPADVVKPAGTLCRAQDGQCDVPEGCDGSAHACPADLPAPNHVACNDGSGCTLGDECRAGTCTGDPAYTLTTGSPIDFVSALVGDEGPALPVGVGTSATTQVNLLAASTTSEFPFVSPPQLPAPMLRDVLTAALTMQFAPAQVGPRQGTLALDTDFPACPHFEVQLVGTGVSAVLAIEEGADPEASARHLRVTNITGAPLTVDEIALDADAVTALALPRALAPGESIDVVVAEASPARTLHIRTSHPDAADVAYALVAAPAAAADDDATAPAAGCDVSGRRGSFPAAIAALAVLGLALTLRRRRRA
jgi:hypothetical protein